MPSRHERSVLSLPERAVLSSVRRVGFELEQGRAPELSPFPVCMAACLDFAGERYWTKEVEAHGRKWLLNGAYTTMMGVTGCAFRLVWQPGWHQDNADIRLMAGDPEAPFFRAFNAAGISYHLLEPGPGGAGIEQIRAAVMRNIGLRRMPLIGLVVVGPPEACLITGYDEGGEVLIGWSYFQGEPSFAAGLELEPGGQFRRRGWAENTAGMLVWGDRLGPPPLIQVYRTALSWGLRLVNTPAVGRALRPGGLAAYAAWAAELRDDAAFVAASPEELCQMQEVHDDAVGIVAEGRWYAAQFLKQVVEDLPEMTDELLPAARMYEAEHDLMWKVWGLTGGIGRGEEHAKLLAEPGARRAIVELIEEARALDQAAAEQISLALYP